MRRSGSIAALLVLCLLLAACGNAETSSGGTSETGAGRPAATAGSGGSSVSGGAGGSPSQFEGEAVITEKPGPTVAIAPGSLSRATLTPDAGKRQSAQYLADGKEVSLQLTDGAGSVWTLTIPGNALESAVTITMTALAKAESKEFSGAGGVLLEPDGLQFLVPATLTVKPAGAPKKALLLTGGHDGSGLEFAAVSAVPGGFSAPITHFSSSLLPPNDDSTLKRLQQKAGEDYKAAADAANELLKKPLEVPTPPSVKLNCYNTAAYKDPEAQIQEFVKAVNSPEREIISRLLGATRSVSLLTGNDPGGLDLAAKVQSRVVRKIDKLIKTFAPQPEKFPPVIRAALEAYRVSSLLGGGEPPLDPLAKWVGKVRDRYLEELRSKHDYTVIPALLPLARWAEVLGETDPNIVKKITDAMTFQVNFDTTLTAEGDDDGEMRFELNGRIETEATLQGKMEGTQNGKYVSFSAPEGVQLMMPNAFPVKAQVLNLDPCEKKTVEIKVDRMGAESETFIAPEYGAAPPVPGIVQRMALGVLNEHYVNQERLYKFTLPLENLQEEAASEKYSGEAGAATLEYHLRLLHTPK